MQRLDLVEQLELALRYGIEAFIELQRQILDLTTGFVVVEHAGARLRRAQNEQHSQRRSGAGKRQAARRHAQYSPL